MEGVSSEVVADMKTGIDKVLNDVSAKHGGIPNGALLVFSLMFLHMIASGDDETKQQLIDLVTASFKDEDLARYGALMKEGVRH